MKQALKNSHNDIWRSVADVSKLWYRLAEKQLSLIGITLSELRALRFLSEHGSCSMVTLARDQLMTPGGMTGLVDHLEGQNLIRRIRSDSDRRIINIEITKEGERVINRAVSVYQQFMEKSLENLDEEEIQTFLRIVKKMIVSGQRRESLVA